MGSDEQTGGGPHEARAYCVVPRELASKLHDSLRRHFQDDPAVEVVVEQRAEDRRQLNDRRLPTNVAWKGEERRRIGDPSGRRVGERRAPVVQMEPPPLPRRAQRHSDRLVFVERLAPTTTDAEDAETARLVTRIQAGESDLFSELYLRYFSRVYGYVRVALNDPHEAEDVTQQVFIKVLEALPRYERRGQPFRAWLFTVVRNATVSHLRKHGRTETTDPDEIARRRENGEEDTASVSVLNWISDRDLVILVERLPASQRQVLVLRFLLDLRVSEVARILDLSPNHVSQLQHRALEFLEERLRSLGREPVPGRRVRIRRRVRQATVLRSRKYALHL
jgi:RNA polymerase sigma-70 factor (ECF subfamily)